MEGATTQQIQAGQGRHERPTVLEPQGRGQGQGRGGQRGWAARWRRTWGSQRRCGREEDEDEERCPKRILPGASGLRHLARADVCVSDSVPEGRTGKAAAMGESTGRCRRYV